MKRFLRGIAVSVYCATLLLTGLGASGCVSPPPQAPAAVSDSKQSFKFGTRIPVDQKIYNIKGKIVGERKEVVIQTQVAHGSAMMIGGYGAGSYFGAEVKGKGFVRVKVEYSDSRLAPVGKIVLLKTTDTKGVLLKEGDTVTFKCRQEYEAVGATMENEVITPDHETWELDMCRLVTPCVD